MHTTLVLGGTGFVGKQLLSALVQVKSRLTVAIRPHHALSEWESEFPEVSFKVVTNLTDVAQLKALLPGHHSVINLAGSPISKRWTVETKRQVVESRVAVTKALVKAIAASDEKPRTLINASAIGYFNGLTESCSETSAKGTGFLADVCESWEKEALAAEALGVSVFIPRLSVVLGHSGGVQQALTPLYKYGLGGPIGMGRAAFPWIHIYDVCYFMLMALAGKLEPGIYHLVAPEATSNGSFSKALARHLNRPNLCRVPAFSVKLILGEMSEIILKTAPVINTKLPESFFKYPSLVAALPPYKK